MRATLTVYPNGTALLEDHKGVLILGGPEQFVRLTAISWGYIGYKEVRAESPT